MTIDAKSTAAEAAEAAWDDLRDIRETLDGSHGSPGTMLSSGGLELYLPQARILHLNADGTWTLHRL